MNDKEKSIEEQIAELRANAKDTGQTFYDVGVEIKTLIDLEIYDAGNIKIIEEVLRELFDKIIYISRMYESERHDIFLKELQDWRINLRGLVGKLDSPKKTEKKENKYCKHGTPPDVHCMECLEEDSGGEKIPIGADLLERIMSHKSIPMDKSKLREKLPKPSPCCVDCIKRNETREYCNIYMHKCPYIPKEKLPEPLGVAWLDESEEGYKRTELTEENIKESMKPKTEPVHIHMPEGKRMETPEIIEFNGVIYGKISDYIKVLEKIPNKIILRGSINPIIDDLIKKYKRIIENDTRGVPETNSKEV